MGSRKWTRLGWIVTAVAAVLIALWGFLSSPRIERRVLTEEVQVFDVAAPPPEAPPTPRPEQPQVTDQTVTAPAPEAPTADPVEALAGDPFAGFGPPVDAGIGGSGPSGQAGSGTMRIGGQAASGASWTYAQEVLQQLQQHLRAEEALRDRVYSFDVRLNVSAQGSVTLLAVDDLQPENLRPALTAALSTFRTVRRPPPRGVSNTIRLNINSR